MGEGKFNKGELPGFVETNLKLSGFVETKLKNIIFSDIVNVIILTTSSMSIYNQL